MSPTETWLAERDLVAQGCRVLVARELADGLLGHVSLRVDDRRLLVRCRGPEERGLADTRPEDVRLVTLDGDAGARRPSSNQVPRIRSTRFRIASIRWVVLVCHFGLAAERSESRWPSNALFASTMFSIFSTSSSID